MDDYEEDENVTSENADDDFSVEEEDEDDPKDSAFLRGVEEAVEIKDEEEEEEY